MNHLYVWNGMFLISYGLNTKPGKNKYFKHRTFLCCVLWAIDILEMLEENYVDSKARHTGKENNMSLYLYWVKI